MTSLKRVGRSESGATAVEYALLIAFVAGFLVVGIAVFGGALLAIWETVIQPGVSTGW